MSHHKINRLFKDTLFKMLMQEEELKRKILPELHSDPEFIMNNEIRDVFVKTFLINDIYNDYSCVAGNELLIFIEAQSTWNANILLRILMYYSEYLKEYFFENQIPVYDRKANIIHPHFYVIYTGNRSIPDEVHLSELFFRGKDANLNLKAKVVRSKYNLLPESSLIQQYIYACQKFNEIPRSSPLEDVKSKIREVVDRLIENNILSDFLKAHYKEVIEMQLALFTDDRTIEIHEKFIAEQAALKNDQKRCFSEAQSYFKLGILKDAAYQELISKFNETLVQEAMSAAGFDMNL